MRQMKMAMIYAIRAVQLTSQSDSSQHLHLYDVDVLEAADCRDGTTTAGTSNFSSRRHVCSCRSNRRAQLSDSHQRRFTYECIDEQRLTEKTAF